MCSWQAPSGGRRPPKFSCWHTHTWVVTWEYALSARSLTSEKASTGPESDHQSRPSPFSQHQGVGARDKGAAYFPANSSHRPCAIHQGSYFPARALPVSTRKILRRGTAGAGIDGLRTGPKAFLSPTAWAWLRAGRARGTCAARGPVLMDAPGPLSSHRGFCTTEQISMELLRAKPGAGEQLSATRTTQHRCHLL